MNATPNLLIGHVKQLVRVQGKKNKYMITPAQCTHRVDDIITDSQGRRYIVMPGFYIRRYTGA